MVFLKKRFKRVTSMGLALLLAVSAFPSAAFAASESTLAEVTAKFLDAENGKEITAPETYGVTHAEKSPQEIENYTYVDYTESVEYDSQPQSAEKDENPLRHHNTLFPKCLTGDCLNRNAGTIRLCVMPQGEKFQGVKTQER